MSDTMTKSQELDWEDTWIDEETFKFLKDQEFDLLKKKWEVSHSI